MEGGAASVEARDHVFINYASEDSDFAEWLTLRLSGEGYRVWCDRVKSGTYVLRFRHERCTAMSVTSAKAPTIESGPALSERELDFQVIRGSSGFIAVFEAFRESQGISTAEVARRADVYREAISRLLNAENPNPTMKSIVQLLAGLDLEMAVTIRPKRPDSEYLVEVGGQFGRERKVAGEDL